MKKSQAKRVYAANSDHVTGSHYILKKGSLRTSVPFHKAVKTKTLRAILKQIEMSIEEFTDLIQPFCVKTKTMIIETLKSLYKRDLEKLRHEIGLYRDESVIWKVDGDITNSAGNLCLHLVGNLNAFIGAELGKSGYVRHRDLEFSTRETPRDELLKNIDETLEVVANALDKVSNEQLAEDYPLVVFAEKMSTGYFLMHLATHLNYHLGQINYHRRVFDQKAAAEE